MVSYNAEFQTKKGKSKLQAGKTELINSDKEINWSLAFTPTKIIFPCQAVLEINNRVGYYNVFEAKEVYTLMERLYEKQI